VLKVCGLLAKPCRSLASVGWFWIRCDGELDESLELEYYGLVPSCQKCNPIREIFHE